MTHPLRVAENCTTHPLHKAQNLMTHSLLRSIISVDMIEICLQLEFGSVDSGYESATRHLKIPFILE